MKISEVMSSPAYTCRPQDSLESAARKLWNHDCGLVVVVDDKGCPGAVLTDRDICMGAMSRGLPLRSIRVAESMSDDVVTCRRGEELAAVARRMAERQLHRLPVVDDEGVACGMLSLNDLAVVGEQQPRIAKHALAVLTAVCRHRTAVPAATPSTPKVKKKRLAAQS